MTFLCRALRRSEFFLCDVVFQGFNAIKVHLFICCFEKVGINADKFEKTRIRFNRDVFATRLSSIFLKQPIYIYERDTFILVLPQTLMIEGGK